VTRHAASPRSGTLLRRSLVGAIVVSWALVMVGARAAQTYAENSTASTVTVRTLAQGTVQKLPAGKIYVNILEFRQVPSTTFTLNPRATGMEYTLHGIATVASPGAGVRPVGAGSGAFLPSLAVQTVSNVDGRVGAAAIATGLIILVVLLAAATWVGGRLRPLIAALLSLLLIAGGAFVLGGGTSNDWYLIVVRSTQIRSGTPMPVPYGKVGYSSPDMDPAPVAPSTETLSSISVPAGGRYDAVDPAGPEMIVVVDGTAALHDAGGIRQLGAGAGAFAQAGNKLSIVNSGTDTLQVVDFAVS
jgi:hypothetical protein